MTLRSLLSRAVGAGSEKAGTAHWWMQRVTAIALLALGLWFVVSIRSLDHYDEADFVAWVADPVNAVMLLLLIFTIAWHSMLGLQVVIEDYVHGPTPKVVLLLISKFAHVFLGVAGVFAILKVALGEMP